MLTSIFPPKHTLFHFQRPSSPIFTPFHVFQITYHMQNTKKFQVSRSGGSKLDPSPLIFFRRSGGVKIRSGGFNPLNHPGISDPVYRGTVLLQARKRRIVFECGPLALTAAMRGQEWTVTDHSCLKIDGSVCNCHVPIVVNRYLSKSQLSDALKYNETESRDI